MCQAHRVRQPRKALLVGVGARWASSRPAVDSGPAMPGSTNTTSIGTPSATASSMTERNAPDDLAGGVGVVVAGAEAADDQRGVDGLGSLADLAAPSVGAA